MAVKSFLKQPQNHEARHDAGSICRCEYTNLNGREIWKQSHKTGQNRTWPHNKSEAKRKKLEIKVKRSKDARLETETDTGHRTQDAGHTGQWPGWSAIARQWNLIYGRYNNFR